MGDVFKDDGCALAYVSVTGRAMNQADLSVTLTYGIRDVTSQSKPCDCTYNPKTSPESKVFLFEFKFKSQNRAKPTNIYFYT